MTERPYPDLRGEAGHPALSRSWVPPRFVRRESADAVVSVGGVPPGRPAAMTGDEIHAAIHPDPAVAASIVAGLAERANAAADGRCTCRRCAASASRAAELAELEAGYREITRAASSPFGVR